MIPTQHAPRNIPAAPPVHALVAARRAAEGDRS
jgi:hypothetical protein